MSKKPQTELWSKGNIRELFPFMEFVKKKGKKEIKALEK